MKNHNMLITLATLLIAIAGIGWLLTSQADNTQAVQQDRIVNTPIREEVVQKAQPMRDEVPVEAEQEVQVVNTDQRYTHRRGHQRDYENQRGQHCHDNWEE